MNKEDIAKNKFEPLLKKIGWKLEPAGGDHYYIVNHLNKRTNWLLWKSRLEYNGNDLVDDYSQSWIVYFNMNKCNVKLSDDRRTVSVFNKEDKSIFVIFMNHDIKKVKENEGV